MLKFIELFAGIGGFSLGFERAGMECVGHCEIDKYAQKVLKKHWPDVPLIEDIKNVKEDTFPKADLICGGFPCQDISIAGKQKGITGERSGLFFEAVRIIRLYRPKWVVLENVANLLTKPEWMGPVFGGLASVGYNAEWEVISAADVGAPHRRERVWIIAYSHGNGFSGFPWQTGQGKGGAQQRKDIDRENIRKPDVAHPNGIRRRFSGESKSKSFNVKQSSKNVSKLSGTGLEIREGEKRKQTFPAITRGDWWTIEPQLGRVANGIPHRVDRLKCLGNALVPQIAELIGNRIMEIECNPN